MLLLQLLPDELDGIDELVFFTKFGHQGLDFLSFLLLLRMAIDKLLQKIFVLPPLYMV